MLRPTQAPSIYIYIGCSRVSPVSVLQLPFCIPLSPLWHFSIISLNPYVPQGLHFKFEDTFNAFVCALVFVSVVVFCFFSVGLCLFSAVFCFFSGGFRFGAPLCFQNTSISTFLDSCADAWLCALSFLFSLALPFCICCLASLSEYMFCKGWTSTLKALFLTLRACMLLFVVSADSAVSLQTFAS